MKVVLKRRMQPLGVWGYVVLKRGVGRMLACLLVGFLLSGIMACKSGVEESNEVDQATRIRGHREKKMRDAARAEASGEKALAAGYLKRVELLSQQTSEGTSLKINVTTHVPLTENQSLSYNLIKNNSPAMETRSDTIPATFYKKNDLLVVEVVLYDGGEEIERLRSDQTAVPNTIPQIKDVKLPEFDGPAIYIMLPEATDADGDTLTYGLEPDPAETSLPEGLTINPTSGEISYTLTETNVPKENVNFIVTVNDGDGGVAKKMVTLEFELKKATKQVKKEEKSTTPEQK